MRPMPGWFTGEFFGTFLLVFFGCGSVCAAVTTGAQVGIFQVAIVWGLGITTAIYLTGALSGAHLNPAVTMSLAGWGDVPFQVNGAGWWAVYLVAPLLGGLLGGGIYSVCFKRAYVADG